MAQIVSKFIDKDANSLEDNGTELRVKVEGTYIERTASGLDLVANSITAGQLAANSVGTSELDLTANYNFTGSLQISGDDVATETYVNNAIQGISPKDSVLVATTANVALTGEQTIDGILTSASRVLVKDQTSVAENGIYVTAAGGWARADDANTWDELIAAYVWTEEGTLYGDTGWLCTINSGGTLGVTDVTWSQFSGGAVISAGDGLTKTGNTINFVTGDTSLTVVADAVTVNVDDITIETVAGGLQIKDAGVDENKIVSTTFGNSLSGGSGTVVDVIVSTFISGGAFEIDGDLLDIDYTGTNYTEIATTIAGHLSGIDTAIGAINTRQTETFTLNGTDITNEYVTLASTPASAGRVVLIVANAGGMYYGSDYQMDGSNPDRLTWTALALATLLASGDKLTVIYDT